MTGFVLVTGGAGFIGSHTCVELLQTDRQVIVMDNLCNASRASLDAVERITQKKVTFIEADVRDRSALTDIFERYPISSVLHFAGLKAVGESTEQPTKYYDYNVNGTLALVETMSKHGCKTLVFSSSATVYGVSESAPLTESSPLNPVNPYGRTKRFVEQMLEDLYAADPEWRISLLRYFNPVGAHASGQMGEDPNDIPNNLMPYISQVAVGKLEKLNVFGDDYETRDGTGIRDYIHVVDLARGHIAALTYLADEPKLCVHNLGTGTGSSVFDALHAFERACGKTLPFKIADRRPGDAAISFADPSKAAQELKWTAEFDLDRMCEDAWRWQSLHPTGYRT